MMQLITNKWNYKMSEPRKPQSKPSAP